MQTLPSSTVNGVPGRHTASASQISGPLHAFPSEHEAPAAFCTPDVQQAEVSGVTDEQHGLVMGVCATVPLAGSHESAVQTFPSFVAIGVPVRHCPAPLQISEPLHRFPSAQDEPDAFAVPEVQQRFVMRIPEEQHPLVRASCLTPVAGSHQSDVQTFPSSVEGGVPATHWADELQVSVPLQRFASAHELPAGLALPALQHASVMAVCWHCPPVHVSVVQGLLSAVQLHEHAPHCPDEQVLVA